MNDRPVALDLCSGLGGWADGLEAEGWNVIRVDTVDMFAQMGCPKPQDCLLILQDIRTFHGSQARRCNLIVASPPCTEFSWMAMPWSRAKQVERALLGEDEFPIGYQGSLTVKDLTALFDACFRIQREACEAARHHIPMVVENVRGAQKWVGRARWNFGPFYLWGDVPALMPIGRPIKVATMGGGWYPPDHPKHVKGLGFNTHADRETRRTNPGNGARFTPRDCGVESRWFNDGPRSPDSISSSSSSSSSPRRKFASAMIAKIPPRLSQYIASVYHPRNDPGRPA